MMITEINNTAQIVAMNDKAKTYLNSLTNEQRADLQSQLGNEAVFCIGHTMGKTFDYVSFFSNDKPKDGDFVYIPDMDIPTRYRQQENAKKIISFSIKDGVLL